MNILVMSNTQTGRYGYSVVFSEVAKILKKAGHNVFYFGMQTLHPPFKDENGVVWLGIRYDAFGADMLGNYLKVYKIDVLITGFDIWLPQVQYIPNLVKQLGVKWICHATINSDPLSPILAAPMSQAHIIVAPSKFAERVIRAANVFKDPNNVVYIPHGVDTSIFKPDGKPKDPNEFRYLTVMRNKGFQKNFPGLFYAYKLVVENEEKLKRKSKLICLTDPLETEGLRLDFLRDRIGMANNIKFIWAKPTKDNSSIMFTHEGDPEGFLYNANSNFSAEEMARLYNHCHVHVLSSSGESFNLPNLEAMACGIPVIAPNFSAPVDLINEGKAGLLAKIKTQRTTPLISDVYDVDEMDLASCMIKLYKDKKLYEECSKNAVEYAKKYDWSKIGSMWVDLVKRLEGIEPIDYVAGRMGV